MEGFSGIISALSKIAPALQSGVGVMGMISQMSMAAKEKAALDRSIYYSKHPEAISAIAKKLEMPLSTGLTQGVENVVNASMAEQGLSQAPGIQSQVLAQAIAPYQQQEQQMALDAALKAIGLPTEALANLKGMSSPTDLASLLKLTMSGRGSGAPTIDPNATDNYIDFPYPTPPSIVGDVPALTGQ